MAKKYVSPKKQSAKQQAADARARRGTWYGVCPVTRVADTSKNTYNRARAKRDARNEY